MIKGLKISHKKFIAISLAGMAIIILFIFNPEETWWMPKCPTYSLTGFECPGCGTQRSIHALLHGDISSALQYNAFLVCILPFICLLGVAEIKRKDWPKLYRRLYSPFVVFSLLTLVVIWTIVRNII